MKRLYAVAACVALGTACSGDALEPASTPAFASALPGAVSGSVTVMTRNVYLGADVDAVISAPPDQVPIAAAQAFATVQATDFPARAEALADEIAATNPHLVGLQEVVLFRTQTPGDAALGGTEPATEVFQDFLEILLDALAARNLDYRVVVVQQAFDAEVPALIGIGPGGPQFMDVRLTDRDAILARGDVSTSDPRGANFTANLPISIGAQSLVIPRGWTSTVATVGRHTFRFVNTHLETQAAPPVQVAQAAELLSIAQADPLPVIMAGDFNSDAGGTQTATYGMLTAAGFRDVWLDAHPESPGLTCCHASDLRNETASFDQRIDLILVGDVFRTLNAGLAGGVHVTVVGDEPADRTPSGLWPSDHAGVVASLRLPRIVAGR
jgi:endonuclease/exonuclease/phosphatase family metal-dependent hydrolase